jgi:hypothetical protein
MTIEVSLKEINPNITPQTKKKSQYYTTNEKPLEKVENHFICGL